MMIRCIITLTLGLFVIQKASSEQVLLRIQNLNANTGKLIVAAFNSKQGFLRNPITKAAFVVAPSKDEIQVSMTLPGSDECIAFSVIHDIDSNQELNLSLFGVPSEPYGFSNNPEALFGPPAFEQACVNPHNQPISIMLSD